MKITAQNIVHAINRLPKGIRYNYINPKTKGLIEIVNVQLPEGPIIIKRYELTKGDSVTVLGESPKN